MKLRCIVGFCVVSSLASVFAQDYLDQVDQALSISAFHDNVRARLSGLVDLEFFRLDEPPLGLINTDDRFLFNPRLTLFLDTQLGPHIYLFLQSRIDRGLDPSDAGAQVRLDEYALRATPWDDGRLSVQIGKFATVIGNWVERHHSWENPFITAPLPYENLTAISDMLVPLSAADFVSQFTPAERYEHNPLIWGPSYATGVSVGARLGKFDLAVEVKNSALSSRPAVWNALDSGFSQPTVSGRAGLRPNESWNFGFSFSSGPYYQPDSRRLLPRGSDIEDFHELLLGQDVSFAWRHWQLWAEFYEVRFEVPRVGNADTFAYYLEAKYKFTPQWFAALRWNQQLFGTVRDVSSESLRWGKDIWEIDGAVAYRFSAHTQLKLQYTLQNDDSTSHEFNHTFGAQFTVRF
jgi:hypothetical protein